MDLRLPTVLALGIIASLANMFGGWIISSRREMGRPALTALVAMGAGFMLAAALLEVIPASIQVNRWASIVILAGYLFVHLVEHTISTHFHFGEETHLDELLHRPTAYSAMAGLALHTFFDGVLIAAGFWISMHLGVLLFLAVLLHKIPEGFTAASIVRAAGGGKRAMNLGALAISLSTFAGVCSISLSRELVAAALPFSAGVTVYVAASDLIPEVNKQPGIAISLGVFLGVFLFFVSGRLLHMVLGM
jgi:ZIP family zinc transporter/zinc and cadmium transporter